VIYCPQCGKRTNVLETRTDLGIARRRRECLQGHQVLTEEHVITSTRSTVQLMSDRDQSEAKRGVFHARA
jgi:transcriptional regulator NrdR family protein